MDEETLKANISILKKENKNIKKKIKLLKQIKKLDQAISNLPSTLSKLHEIEELITKEKIQDFNQQLKQLPTYSTKNAKQRIEEIDQETKNLDNEQKKLNEVNKEIEKETLNKFNKTCIIM